jgi:hypothetical protein
MNRQQIIQIANSNPQVQEAVDIAEQQVSQMNVNPQMLDEIIAVLEHVMDRPNDYPAIRAAAIRDQFIGPEDLPEQFDPVVIVALLSVFYGLKDRAAQKFARGGLSRLANQGRGGDTMLAHVNPMEAEMLRRMGGSGTVNPNTGLREFKGGGLVDIIKTVAPIALAVAAPGMGTLMSAGLGAALGAADGGGLKGALTGGALGALGAGGAGALGAAAGEAAGLGLSAGAQNVLGSSLAGGALGALSGQGAQAGLVQGALGGLAGNTVGGLADTSNAALNAGIQTGGSTMGNLLTVGADPATALKGGALAGLARGAYSALNPEPNPKYELNTTDSGGLGLKSPSDIAVEGLKAPNLNTSSVPEMGLSTNYSLTGDGTPTFNGPETPAVDYSLTAPAAQTASAQPELGTGIQQSPLNAIADQATSTQPSPIKNDGAGNKMGASGLSLGSAASMLPLLSLFSSAQTPDQVQQVVAGMTPEQKEYFNRPMRTWNWDTLGAAAKMQGLPLGSYIARNWDKVGGGMYDKPVEQPVAKARGGALTRLASGGGSGRDDTIPARLSDGEYVMDAETVSLLGDGSTKDGARRLDEMRAKIREHKGKSMARGKFSANAKSPLAYLKGA